MKLTLSLPGLIWPDAHDGAEVTRGLEMPALAQLLGRAHVTARPRRLSELIGLPFGVSELKMARLAALRDGLAASAGHWLLADPVHLRIERDQALLADVGVMNLSQDEADALTGALNLHFAEDGLRFHAPAPGRWYLELSQSTPARFTALPDVVGENVDRHLPQGDAGLNWSRMLNEAQMLLYTHPVNQAREARNETPVNSLWLWGGGESAVPSAPACALCSDDDIMRLLARISGAHCDPAPYSLAALLDSAPAAASCWVHLDGIEAAAQYRDAWGWREGLERLEADWFAPLLPALRQGRIEQLDLITHGETGFSARVGRADLWKFWRGARPLASLY